VTFKIKGVTVQLSRKYHVKFMSLIFLPFIIFLSLYSLVHAEWIPVIPPAVPVYSRLTAIHFTSAYEGWAVGTNLDNSIGWNGILLHYVNERWSSVATSNVSADWGLAGVHFTSANEGWAVGHEYLSDRGVLLHYLNGEWTSVTPPTVSSYWELDGVHFTSANEGWAVGRDNDNGKRLLLRYAYGDWTLDTPPLYGKNLTLYGVHATHATQGWAVGHDISGEQGALVHLYGGGWTEVDNPPAVSANWELRGVHFTSVDEGWAVGTDFSNNRGVLLRCQDGWNWTSVNPPAVGANWELHGVYFTSAAEGWAVGRDNADSRVVLLHYLAVSPNTGTIGTKLTLTGSDFGTKKGKVLIGGTAMKVINWDASSITCEINKTLPQGPHDVVIQRKDPKNALPITHSQAFTIMAPKVEEVKPFRGPVKTSVLLSGTFFGTKKGKVYLGDKKCKVLSWSMDETTGESGILFIVPDKMPPRIYSLTVTNKMASVTQTDGFTIIP
jgi:hypothetical protein